MEDRSEAADDHKSDAIKGCRNNPTDAQSDQTKSPNKSAMPGARLSLLKALVPILVALIGAVSAYLVTNKDRLGKAEKDSGKNVVVEVIQLQGQSVQSAPSTTAVSSQGAGPTSPQDVPPVIEQRTASTQAPHKRSKPRPAPSREATTANHIEQDLELGDVNAKGDIRVGNIKSRGRSVRQKLKMGDMTSEGSINSGNIE